MADRILVDTGPLVAVFRDTDAHRQACLDELHRLSNPLIICWPVLTEASHLLRKNQNAVRALLGWFDDLVPANGCWFAPALGCAGSALNANVARFEAGSVALAVAVRITTARRRRRALDRRRAEQSRP